MQRWLLAQDGVIDAEVTSVPAPGRGVRLLAAVVAPGVEEDTLRQAMLGNFAPATVPRRLLMVEQLPREASGKLPRRQLMALFGLRPDGSPPSTTLKLGTPRAEPDDPSTFVTAVGVPADYVYFDGHFDTYPILAGVVQLHELLLPLVEQVRPGWGPLSELLRVKFLGRIVPGDELTVTLRLDDQRHDCEFELAHEAKRFSAGKLRFAPPAEATDP